MLGRKRPGREWRQQWLGPTTRLIPPPLTFAFVSWVAGQSVSIETLLAAVAEEAVRVVDALETFPGFTVTVANRVRVDVVAALAGATGSDRSTPAQRVPEEAVITELTALTCQDDIRQKDDLRDGRPLLPWGPAGPADLLPGLTCGPGGTVGADHLPGSQDKGAGRSGRAGTRLAIRRRPAAGVTIETILTALAAQTGCVVLTIASSWTNRRQRSQQPGRNGSLKTVQ